MAEPKETRDIMNVAINPEDFIPQMASDRLRSLYMELEDMMEVNSDREILIGYLAGNFATNTHLCVTILRGKDTRFIQDLTGDIRRQIKEELDARKASGSV